MAMNRYAGLDKIVYLAIGLQYEISTNISMDDGLLNGASCFLMKLDHRNEHRKVPNVLWVKFSDSNIGKKRQQYRM